MSSKRGRKRNDNLPPNRARDVQRAFRARRAAHLHALEERVSELEEENNYLRLALRLPPSTRPPLGKGPTGKDNSKANENFAVRSIGLGFNSGAGSSDGHSPASRASSISPSGIGVSMSSHSHPMTVIDANWDESMILNDHHQNPTQHSTDGIQSSSDISYTMTSMATAMSAPLAVKPTRYAYNESFASSSRALTHMYSGSPTPYQNSPKVMGPSYGNQAFIRGDVREESSQQYPYSQSYTPHESTSAHRQTPSPSLRVHSSHNIQPSSRESPLPYPPPHRRSVTDPLGYSIGQGFPHLPNPVQPQQQPSSRSSGYIRPLDNHNLQHGGQSSRPGPYAPGPDDRLNPQP